MTTHLVELFCLTVFQFYSKIDVTTVPLYDQTDFTADADFVGIDVEIKNKKTRFMIDTGATINLITKNSFLMLGLFPRHIIATSVNYLILFGHCQF